MWSMNSFSGTRRATYPPRFLSGTKIICLFGRPFTTFTAFEDVQQMSDTAFVAADEFT